MDEDTREFIQLLVDALKAVLNLADGGKVDLPDSGEFSGAAITDLVNHAVEEARLRGFE